MRSHKNSSLTLLALSSIIVFAYSALAETATVVAPGTARGTTPGTTEQAVPEVAPGAAATSSPEAAVQPKEKEAPPLRKGVIASSGKFARSASVDLSSDDKAAGGEEPSPISASVTRIKSELCEVIVKNTAEKGSYSISYTVVGTRASGSQSLRRPYSATIGAGKSTSNTFSCDKDLNLSVVLNSGRKIK